MKSKIKRIVAQMAERGTLKGGEPHPSALHAKDWVISKGVELLLWQEAFSSCAIEGNRLGEICSETLNRLMKGQPVSDRYLLGLVWAMAYPEITGISPKEPENEDKE